MHRDSFLMLNQDIIYFDNAATSLKPKIVIDSLTEYYSKYSANIHRGDYDLSIIVSEKYENARKVVKNFIGANKSKEIIFTSGTTDSLNKIIFGYFRYNLNKGDEILLTKSEHASNVLPWFELSDEIGCKINYIKLTKDLKVTLENVKKAITPSTKVISIAHITNVVGDIRPVKEIIEYAHKMGILVVIDGAQSVAHIPVNVSDLDIDFMAFSAHKMCGPTGVGILYGKEKLLNNIRPIIYGGGMNALFKPNGYREYMDLPYLLEAGTPNIADIIAFGEVIKYLNKIGMDNIHKYELNLKKYAIEQLKEVSNIILYNENNETGIIAFNINGIFSQDLALYLNKYNIYVRAGNHCAKILQDELGMKNTCRISLYFYNTKEEVDRLIEVLKNPNLSTEII